LFYYDVFYASLRIDNCFFEILQLNYFDIKFLYTYHNNFFKKLKLVINFLI